MQHDLNIGQFRENIIITIYNIRVYRIHLDVYGDFARLAGRRPDDRVNISRTGLCRNKVRDPIVDTFGVDLLLLCGVRGHACGVKQRRKI